MANGIPIRTYQRQVEESALPRSRESQPDYASRGLGNIAKGFGDLAAASKSAGQDASAIVLAQDNAVLNAQYAAIDADMATILNDFTANELGDSAVKNSPKAIEAYEFAVQKRREELGTGIGSEGREKRFNQIVAGKRVQFEKSVNAHVNREGKAYAERAFSIAASSAKDRLMTVAAEGADPDELRVAVAEIDILVAGRGAALKWTEEEIEHHSDILVSDAHIAAVDSLLDGDRGADAREYFEDNREQIDNAMLGKSGLQERMRRISKLDDARGFEEAAWDSTEGDAQKAIEEIRGKAAAGKMDTAVMDMAIDRVLSRARDRNASQDLQDDPKLTEMFVARFEKKPGYQKDNEAAFSKLTPRGKLIWFRSLLAERRASLNARHQLKQMQNDYNRLAVSDAGRLSIEDQAELTDPVVVARRFPDADQRTRFDLQKLGNRAVQVKAKLSGVDSTAGKHAAMAMAERNGMEGAKGSQLVKGTEADRFVQAVKVKTEEFILEHKRPPTTEEAAVIRALVFRYGEAKGKGTFDDPDRRGYNLKAGEVLTTRDFREKNAEELAKENFDEDMIKFINEHPSNQPVPTMEQIRGTGNDIEGKPPIRARKPNGDVSKRLLPDTPKVRAEILAKGYEVVE